MVKFFRIFIVFIVFTALSGCVTHNYENDNDTPVVETDASNNEIAMTRISLGMGYLKMGNTEQAKINLEKAKRFAPKLTQVYTAFAHYYDTVGEPELAVESYDKALSIDPDDADTLNNYGVFLCRQGEYQKAEEKILQAIAIPSYILVSQSYENLALCELKAHRFDKAEGYFDKAILHSPSRASSLLQMARLQYIEANYPKAQTYIKRYERAARNFSPQALALAYKINQKMHKTTLAKNYASMLVKMFPNAYETKQYLLDGLAKIEADELADIYHLQQIAKKKRSKKKKVVVLSPNKKYSKTIVEQSPKSVEASNKQIKSDHEVNVKAPSDNHNTNKTTFAPDDKITPPLFHIIKKGDNLFSVSKEYNIHMKALEKWNNITRTTIIKIGDKIYLADPSEQQNSEE